MHQGCPNFVCEEIGLCDLESQQLRPLESIGLCHPKRDQVVAIF